MENITPGSVATKPVVNRIPKSSMKKNLTTLVVSILIVVFGGATGWYFAQGGRSSGGSSVKLTDNVVATDKEAGAKDETQFSTTTEGILREGGVKGEGTHHLERTGGESQNAYLTSTTFDMSPFVGKKVKVWGETISGVHAGWLIDVGKIKVID